MNSRIEIAPYREHWEHIPLTRLERLRAWFWNVYWAARETPPKTRLKTTRVWPGDPRFEGAMGVERRHWMSFKFDLKKPGDQETKKEETK